jgi:hypothetical protein
MTTQLWQALCRPVGRFERADVGAAVLIAIVLVLSLAVVGDYAVSNDEEVQHRYGELILDYYASGFTDRTVFAYKNLYLYGGLFDVVAILIGKLLPFDVFAIRHVLCALTGVAGIAATWATARRIAGPRAGLIAALALALCGPWFGTMFNHTKDIPFAAAMIGATYFLLRAGRELPYPRLRHLLGFGVLLGAALGLRAMGLVFALYAMVAIAMCVPWRATPASIARFTLRAGLSFAPGFVVAYLIMLAAWPWAALDPFNPIRAVFAFAHFHYPIKTLLAGETYMMAEVPPWYVPTYIVLAMAFTALRWNSADDAGRKRRRDTALVAFTAIFPVASQVIGGGPAFSGMRHFIFVVPPLAVLAGVGFDCALAWLQARQMQLARAAAILVGAWFVWTGSVLIRLHPYEYLFFNPIVGGLSGAADKYDTDYWVNVMHEAVVELESFLDRENPRRAPRRYFVAVCGERLPFDKEAKERGRLQYAVGDDPADFFIAPTHQKCDTAIDGRVIVTIARMGVPIGVVKDRRHLTQPELVRGNR